MNRGYVVTESERKELLNWVLQKLPSMDELVGKRKEYILKPEDKSIPPLLWKVKERLVERWVLQTYRKEPTLGDFVGVILPQGMIHKHRDKTEKGMSHIRFNIFLQLPEGGETFYAGTKIDARECGYVISRSSEDLHWSNPVRSGLRISLSFGFLVPSEKLSDFTVF